MRGGGENKNEKDEDVRQMLGVWNDLTNLKEEATPSVSNALKLALHERFDGSLDLWKQYVSQIASSKFLMGESPESPHFKAKLLWVLKPQTISQILIGRYTLGDRKVTALADPLNAKLKAINHELAALDSKKTIVANEAKSIFEKQMREGEKSVDIPSIEAAFYQKNPLPDQDSNSLIKTLHRIERDLFVRAAIQESLGLPDKEEFCCQRILESGLSEQIEALKARQAAILQRIDARNDAWIAFCRRHQNGSQESKV